MKRIKIEQKAFTLVEAVVSAALMGVLLICTVQFFNSAHGATNRISNYVVTEATYNSIVEEFRSVNTEEEFTNFTAKYRNVENVSFPSVSEYITSSNMNYYGLTGNKMAILRIKKTGNELNDLVVVQYLK